VELRVEAAPVTSPIQAFLTVTGANGEPVPGLTLSDFTVTIDGAALTSPPSFTLPPNQDPAQKVSVVFAMDYSGSVTAAALQEMQTAVTTFIGAMSDGDFAAIVKFSGSAGASLVQPFTEINSTTKGQLNDVVMADYPSGRTNLLDALNLSINQFTPPTQLPPGPKAVIAVTDGGDNASQVVEGVVHDNARANSIPIFVIGVSTIINPNLLTRLATLSGGDYIPAPNPADISAAYVTISELLNNEYLLSIQSSITDCNPHTLAVTVALPSGQESASLAFVRCGAPPPPPPPPPSGSGSSGGGGGVGAVALLGCLLALIARRRREWPRLPAREINRSSC
jgi:VWFA-related protein